MTSLKIPKKQIHAEAHNIHPKLLRVLSFDDLFDPKLDTNKIEEKYLKVVQPKMKQFFVELDKMLNSHMHDFLEGWVLMHPEEHYAMDFETGKYIATVPVGAYDLLDSGDVLIDVELQEYWDVVREIKDNYNIRPFWERSYSLFGNGQRPNLSSFSTPQKYIKYNRDLYDSPQTTSKLLGDLAKDLVSLPYEISFPIMHKDERSALLHGDTKKIIKHHKVLHAFFDTYGKDVTPEVVDYSSYNDDDNNIKFTRIQY